MELVTGEGVYIFSDILLWPTQVYLQNIVKDRVDKYLEAQIETQKRSRQLLRTVTDINIDFSVAEWYDILSLSCMSHDALPMKIFKNIPPSWGEEYKKKLSALFDAQVHFGRLIEQYSGKRDGSTKEATPPTSQQA